jgi:enoyl-CoA hydratase/carnithine racemase
MKYVIQRDIYRELKRRKRQMEGFEFIKIEKEDDIGIITINRPPVNALNEAALKELSIALEGFRNDESVRTLIIPGGGGTQRMPRLIGRAKALETLLFGERITAAEALEIGLINKVSKSGELMKDVKELAARLAKQAPIAVGCILDAVNRGINLSLEEGLKIEAENLGKAIRTKDFREEVAAFIAKREPIFKGK